MQGALIILAVTVAVGCILYIFELRRRRLDKVAVPRLSDPSEAGEETGDETPADGVGNAGAGEGHGENGVCCGMHIVCEKDTLSPQDGKIVYYDDEELDRFAGREPDSYLPEEIDEFQDVLITLRPEDVVGWARSIQLRGLNLPPMVHDELLMIVNEQRANS